MEEGGFIKIIDLKLSPDEHEDIPWYYDAYIFHDELYEGIYNIYLGSNSGSIYVRDKARSQHYKYPNIPSFSERMENDIEVIISHEIIHILLFKWFGQPTCSSFDNLKDYHWWVK